MAPSVSKLVSRNAAVGAGSALVFIWLYRQHKKATSKSVPASASELEKIYKDETKHGKKKQEKVAVDAVFFSRLWRILKILIPGWSSPEAGYLLLVAATLVARTYCDIWMIQNGTFIESAIIGRNMKLFNNYLFAYVKAMPAISIVNNLLKYGLSELKLRFRARLTHHLYSQYLNGFTYYKMSNLDNRISNADQLLTQDTEKFCDSIADLYSNVSKPLLDICLYSIKLAASIGAQGPSFMMLYMAFSGLILTRLRRPIAHMTMMEQRYEGEFRYVNSRLITNSEEIAFYQGNEREKCTILGAFQQLVNHLRTSLEFRSLMGIGDNIIAKYVATLVGYTVVSRPFLNLQHPRHMSSTPSERLEDYYQSGRMLVKLAEAIGRLVLAGREMTRLAGFTARVTELMRVLNDLNKGRYQRSMLSDNQGRIGSSKLNVIPGSGKIIEQDYIIKFDKMPLVTPNGDVLVRELNFEVKSGTNVLICGPNGCGKSSLFRVLGELWPLFGGTLTKPKSKKLFYVPQRPYMTIGTLRDQIIYPDTHEDQLNKFISDKDLADLLEKVQLLYILDRDEGWDAVQDWMDVLSGGEKQRIAMARLFYHKPQFAILDECTSAVSVDVESSMYQYCREVGITLFTVSHRKSLWKHHEYYLHMDGQGEYEFKRIESDTVEFGS
ncbi:PREDICTED: ATP-binding cassette sub-family D member 3-like [Priapulus caudatus]|uniref:ATP-binding cassette sub-family D member 3-like n=1 Tax=Priapulus caudatus TaxID=37621 RepID=A0ABM1EY61_PRICU|nr:PREDICTED: ATP-binding cassette sub-family D member 3-like [Priapulus caudatus]